MSNRRLKSLSADVRAGYYVLYRALVLNFADDNLDRIFHFQGHLYPSYEMYLDKGKFKDENFTDSKVTM